MWIRPRKVVAQWLGQDSSDQETSAAPVAPPAQCCDVCGLEDHDRANCWAVIKNRADVERTWSGSRWSAGEGDTFELMREWWRRVHEER